MLSVYVSVAATVIASINTMISAYLTNFPPQNVNVRKHLIIASIIMTGFAALSVVCTAVKETNDRASLVKTREAERQQIGEFIAEGNLYLAAFRDNNQVAPTEQANNWGYRVEVYLDKELGHGYIQRFRDGSGMLHGTPSGIDNTRASYWNGVYERVDRLEQFSGEIPH